MKSLVHLPLEARIRAGVTGSVKQVYAFAFDPDVRRGELDIYDVVGDEWSGTTANSVLWQLRTLDVDDLTVRVNSVGGDVTAGMDIYNLLREHPAKSKVARISGVAASIASIIPLGCDRVEMYSNSQFMVHDPYASPDPCGPPMREEDLLRSAKLLSSIKGQMFAIYAKKTGLDLEEIAMLCKVESWMTAEEALAKGFVDAVLDEAAPSKLMTMSARAWEPRLLAAIRAPKSLRMVAQAARLPENRSDENKDPPKMRRHKIKNLRTKLAAQSGSLTAMLAALVSGVSSIKAEEITPEDLDALKSELEESAAYAEELEKEKEARAALAAEYEESKKALEEAKGRIAKGEEEMEELKKKMSDLKAADGDDKDDDVPEGSASAEHRSLVMAASRGALRRAAVVALEITGAKDVGALEGALVAYSVKSGKDPKQSREARVSKMIADGRLLPARKAWALATSEHSLDAYEEGLGPSRLNGTQQHSPNDEGARALEARSPGSRIAAEGSPERVAAESQIRKLMGTNDPKFVEARAKFAAGVQG